MTSILEGQFRHVNSLYEQGRIDDAEYAQHMRALRERARRHGVELR